MMDIQIDLRRPDFEAMHPTAKLFGFNEEAKMYFGELDSSTNKQWTTWCACLGMLHLEAEQSKGVPEWISISDRIPEEGQEVLVHHFGQIEQVTKDKKCHGGFKRRNCYGWETCYGSVSHWLPISIELPKSHHFYYENDAKRAREEVAIKAQEQK